MPARAVTGASTAAAPGQPLDLAGGSLSLADLTPARSGTVIGTPEGGEVDLVEAPGADRGLIAHALRSQLLESHPDRCRRRSRPDARLRLCVTREALKNNINFWVVDEDGMRRIVSGARPEEIPWPAALKSLRPR